MPQLVVDDVTLTKNSEAENLQVLLEHITLSYQPGHLCAIVGPSGSGKSTLLRVIAGLVEPTSGRVLWNGRDLAKDGDFEPGELGYVPQFSIAQELLTVREVVEDAVDLRLRATRQTKSSVVAATLRTTGLEAIAARRVKVLSGGQLRRLALAVELVSDPRLLLCDEVTSGLDARSEQEIWALLRGIACEDRLVIVVTHGLRFVGICDDLTVLHQGRCVFNGTPQKALEFFQVTRLEDIFHALDKTDEKSFRE